MPAAVQARTSMCKVCVWCAEGDSNPHTIAGVRT